MEEWKECKLEQVCENIYSGGTPATMVKEYWNGNLSWLSSGETGQRYIYSTEKTITQLGVDNSSTRYAYKNSTVVASAGQGYTRGQASFLTIDTYVNQSVIVLKPNIKLIDPRYLYFNIDNRYAELRQLSDCTSTRGSLSGKIMKDLSIKLPPLPTQQKIARILSSFDDKIELNNKINTNLEQQAQALFKNWFVDFEPFGGKMPEGWKVGKLSEIIDIRDGTHDSPKFHDSGYPLVTSKHLDSFKIDFSDMKYITEEDFEKINERSKVDTGDILYSMIGTVGNISLVIDNPVQFAIKNVGLFKTSQTPLYKYFVLNYLKTQDIKNYIDQHLAGSTQKYISLSELRGIPLFVPDTNTLEKFNSLVDPITSGIINNINENKRLSTLRDTLLPKLMSKEIEI